MQGFRVNVAGMSYFQGLGKVLEEGHSLRAGPARDFSLIGRRSLKRSSRTSANRILRRG